MTPNLAIDKTMVVAALRPGAIHRPERVVAVPGGKGVNVARALRTLGEDAMVVGWIGGFAGVFIEERLRREGLALALLRAEFESRTCLSILDRSSGQLTELYEQGEPVPGPKVAELLDWFHRAVRGCRAVTLSGSLPPGVGGDFYIELLTIAHGAGVPALLDTSGEPLRRGLEEGRPRLIKPNAAELAALVGVEPAGPAEAAEAAAELSARHGAAVVVSLGPQGAVAVDGQTRVHVRPPTIDTVSAVGSGDCTLAGLARGLARGLSLAEATADGVAAGAANALSVGAGTFGQDDFARIRALVTIEPI
ncbi:MAG: 1-phosphofructokinase family hexose kinase [Chloroflexales bacterium]|nr:1-phosphofructokinase family hexose kinase [Chloroflexales bacterium]